MNELKSITMPSPTGENTTCANFVIDTVSTPYILKGVMEAGTIYAISFWAKADASRAIYIADKHFSVTPTWTKYTHSFEATSNDLHINFSQSGSYCMYHLQLEVGNKPTDWGIAPEDVEEAIKKAEEDAKNAYDLADEAYAEIEVLEDCIKNLVRGTDNSTCMVQGEDGWYFSFGSITDEAIAKAKAELSKLTLEDVDTEDVIKYLRDQLDTINEWVDIGKYYIDGNPNNTDPSNVQPCIKLAEKDSEFEFLITNTSCVFFDGSTKETSIDKDGIQTDNLSLSGELKQSYPNAASGFGSFVWSIRSNGNYGLVWKE